MLQERDVLHDFECMGFRCSLKSLGYFEGKMGVYLGDVSGDWLDKLADSFRRRAVEGIPLLEAGFLFWGYVGVILGSY